ncbi:hypothetical protein HK099_002628, partial [Clydaea vesicula]
MDINNVQEQIHNVLQQIYHVQQQITDTSTQIQTYISKRQTTEQELFQQNDGWYMNLLETTKLHREKESDLQKEKNILLNLQLVQLQRADTENLLKRVKQDYQE